MEEVNQTLRTAIERVEMLNEDRNGYTHTHDEVRLLVASKTLMVEQVCINEYGSVWSCDAHGSTVLSDKEMAEMPEGLLQSPHFMYI